MHRVLTAVVVLALCAGCQPAGEAVEGVGAIMLAPFAGRAKDVTTYFADTEDDWTLALHRYEPKRARKNTMPVILCHGLGYNGNFWDLDEQHSFAGYLCGQGYDVWIQDLRGGGLSTRPGWVLLHGPELDLEKLLKTRIDKFDWTIDDHILHDAPTAIDLVKKERGAEKVVWIGHSLGGMVGLGYIERSGRDDIAAIAVMAAPMIVEQPPSKIMSSVKTLRPVLQSVNNRFNAILHMASIGTLDTPLDALFYNKENMDSNVVSELYRKGAEDISDGVLNQVFDTVDSGQFRSKDREFNYVENLGMVQAPILLVAGFVDNMATVGAVRYTYNQVGSEDKEMLLFSIANGYSVNYGHSDLVLGKKASREVFPEIGKWLKRHNKTK